ncbi:hypothetical protein [Bradyrhizobium lupini]|uniref:hypothetical protein n=1 Tax=Rhizobium lupini TaxID=136996 RepID=UPI0034C62251
MPWVTRNAFRAWAVLIDAATVIDGVVKPGAPALVRAYVDGLITLDELREQACVHVESQRKESA